MSKGAYCLVRADMKGTVIAWRQANALRAAMRDVGRGRRGRQFGDLVSRQSNNAGTARHARPGKGAV